VKLVDIVDFNGSFLTRVRDLIGANPIILVATKVDLLPKGTSLEAVADWLTQATLARKLNVISIHLTSAKAATGISGVASVIQRQRQGRDVYVMGSANVGKSAFITALLRECFLGFPHNPSEFPWVILGIQFSEPPW
jgi:nitric-oxide synthase